MTTPRSWGIKRATLYVTALLVVLPLAGLTRPAAAAPPPPPTVPVPTDTVAPTATAVPSPTMPVSSQGVTLNIAPTHGLTNTVVTVQGTGFEPTVEVRVHWESQSTVVARSTPDGEGHFTVNITIPSTATPGGHEIVATDGPKTAYVLVQVDAAPSNTVSDDQGWCVDVLGAHLCIPTPSSLVYGLANNIAHFWGNAFTLATAGFNQALVASPDITKQSEFSGIKSMQAQLTTPAGALFVFFLTIGAIAAYLTAIGRGQFEPLLGPTGRAMLVTGFIAGYNPIMSKAFELIGDLAQGINNISVGANATGFDALGQAFGTIGDLTSVTTTLKGFVILAGVFISLLAVVIRYLALGYLDLLYTVGPICLVTWVSPQFSFFARWWWRTTLGLALYPIGYALVLKVIANLLTGTSSFGQGFGSLVSALAALGLVLMIYRVPAMIGSAVGAGSSVFGAAASAVTDAAISAGIAVATRGMGDTVLGNRPTPGGQP